MDRPLTASEVIDRANSLGCQVSRRQFDRWRQHGLLQPPVVRKSLGRGSGVKGLYAEEAVDRLVALSKILERDRRLDLALVALSARGFLVSPDRLREVLCDASRSAAAAIDKFLDDEGLTLEGYDAVESLVDSPRIHPPLGRIRRRLGKELFADLARVLLFVAGGHGSDLRSRKISIESIVQAFGLSDARKTWMKDANLRQDVLRIAQNAFAHSWAEGIQQADNELISGAAAELAGLLRFWHLVKTPFTHIFGPDAMGFGRIPDIDLIWPYPDSAVLVAAWIRLRQFDEVKEGVVELMKSEDVARSLDLAVREHPEIAGEVKKVVLEKYSD